ncbi:hypothetical protein LTR56_027327 [Elasticomyces elasticus]|nr:hypothetical protein LTR56_027327 [Elasticomyces elasticus]KAK5734710.1 hypothetical protein LTS12_026646 [Elasticomyces elasticus]
MEEAAHGTQLSSENIDSTLDDAIASSDIDVIHTTLDKRFEIAATGSWSWLSELKELKYSNLDIAELLLARHQERPWIRFDQWILAGSIPDRTFHVSRCVHQYERPTQHKMDLRLEEGRDTSDARNMRSAVASLCGIGGIVPSNGTREGWKRVVDFPDDSSAVVHYGKPGSDDSAVLKRVIGAMDAFCTALDIVQRVNACCDTFTVLVTSAQVQGPSVVELQPIRIGDALDFLISLKDADVDNPASLENCGSSAELLLKSLEYPLGLLPVIHRCALAVQFLTLGLVSYCQAHVEGIDVFFLEEKLASVQLAGAARKGHYDHYPGTIHFKMQRLTCLDGMLGNPVMVFTRPDLLASLPVRSDVLATTESLLDTWGPGGMVANNRGDSKFLTTLTLRGGKIYSVGQGRFHWSLGEALVDDTDRAMFRTNEAMLIGAIVEVNLACRCTEQKCLAKCQSHSRPLGTVATHMRQRAMEYGVQAGQYLVLTASKVFDKVPGVPLEEVVLNGLQRRQLLFGPSKKSENERSSR